MRILYGVVGEGMGHATRSRVILEELVKEHEVQVVASGRAHAYLAERFPDVHRIWGFTLHYEGNAIRRIPTVLRNLRGAVGGWPRNVAAYFKLVASFYPDVVVSDFESFSYYFGKAHGIPVIDLDNIHVISKCRHSPDLLRGHEQDFGLDPQRGGGEAPPLLPLRHPHLLLPGCPGAADHARSASAAPGDPRGTLRAGSAPPRLPDRDD